MAPAPIVHFEIGCANSAQATVFYRELFGWEFQAYGPSQMIRNVGRHPDGTGAGITGHISSLGHPPHQYVTIYALVDNIEASLARVVALGGKVVVSQTEVPGMGSFAWFKDPEGNVLGLWKGMA